MGLMKFTKTALKNLVNPPVTEGYPFTPKVYPERARGKVSINKDNCILCGICASKCPSLAISVDKAQGTWSIQRMGCVQCANCVENCPKHCLEMVAGYTTPGTSKVVDVIMVPVKEKPKKVAPAAEKPQAASTTTEKTPVSDLPVTVDMSSCVLCGACVGECPNNAITVGNTWELNAEACVQCGACAAACPCEALTINDGNAQEAPAESVQPTEKTTPAAPAEPVEIPSTPVTLDTATCIVCGVCAKKCPVGALETDRTTGRWSIDGDNCVQCGVCVDTCPKKSLTINKDYEYGCGDVVDIVSPEKAKPQKQVKAPTETTVKVEKNAPTDTTAPVNVNEETCILCGICSKKCPVGAIDVARKENRWTIDKDNCVQCGICVDTCPKKSLTLNEEYIYGCGDKINIAVNPQK